jgi:hypothetical protein
MKTFTLTDFGIDPAAPMSESTFYKFMIETEHNQPGHRWNVFFDAFDAFTATHGFRLNVDRVTEDTLTTLNHIHDTYNHSWVPVRESLPFGELFTPATDPRSRDAFSFSYTGPKGRFTPTPRLVELLSNRGLVYDLEPANYYFEIIKGGVLFIKYQHIIGSRRVAYLIPETVPTTDTTTTTTPGAQTA